MKIRYLGHSCFQLIGQDGMIALTDPYKGVGYELPADVTADIVTISHEHFDHNNADAIKGSPLLLRGAGKQKIREIGIEGIESFHDPKKGALRGKNTIFKINIDGITFCHLGDLGEEFSLSLVEKIGEADVLLIPVGGTYTIDAVLAKKYAEAIAPKYTIPMHYLPNDGALDITNAKLFLSMFEKVENCPCGEYELSVEDFEKTEQNEMKIIYMERMKKA